MLTFTCQCCIRCILVSVDIGCSVGMPKARLIKPLVFIKKVKLSHNNLYNSVIVKQLLCDCFTTDRPRAEWRMQFLNEKASLGCTRTLTPSRSWYSFYRPQKDGSLSLAICPGVELNRYRHDWTCGLGELTPPKTSSLLGLLVVNDRVSTGLNS